MKKLIVASLFVTGTLAGTAASAGPKKGSLTAPNVLKATTVKTLPGKASPKRGKDDQLSTSQIVSRLVKGTPGDWKFVGAGSGSLRSGVPVRVGSDYSGHCLTYKSQKRGINLGHIGNCNKTQDGVNVTFAIKGWDKSKKVIRYGDLISMSVSGADKDFVCYGARKYGINLNWGASNDGCRALEGSKSNSARQWKLLPPAGSKFKVGEAVPLDGRFALHNVVAGEPVVKCARVYSATSNRAGDLKWRKDCMRHEVVWTHRELVEDLGKDPKKLALSLVPAKYRKYLEMVL